MSNAVLSSEAILQAVLSQGPMIVNDYVLTGSETDDECIIIARRGSEEQIFRIPKGKTGPQGETGEAGPQGPKGPKGDKGDKGDTGETGPQGIQGIQGEVGPKGDKGEKGDKGDAGPQGEQGIQGNKGDKGDKGETGATGSKGDKGDPGPKGDKGDPGEGGGATNLVNGEAVGSLRSVGAIPETDEYKLGQYAVALGPNTMASKNSSFAVGRATHANGNAAFAEGMATIANGNYSHAEGSMTNAYAEGSHAEGYGTSAFGRCAHSEGENTSADSDHQHVQGKYNKYDHDGKYSHIVGNGTDENNRSNAHTLDWNGNAWFQGDVIVGGKSQDDADAKVLATKEYVEQKVGEIEIPEVPSLDGYATEKYVDDKVDSIKIPEMPEIPAALPNPNALTFSGAANGSYDGSEPLSVNIPDGVKSWNDLTDKPFDMKKTVVLPETALVGNMDDGSTTITDPLSIEPVVGKTYVVNWHGKKYECVAGEVDIDFMCTYLGNVGAAGAEGFEDTGEPFMILFAPSAYAPVVGFTAAIYALDGSAGGVVSVDYVEVIKKIDESLLPEDYINSLIDAKIAAIPSAEEASF